MSVFKEFQQGVMCAWFFWEFFLSVALGPGSPDP
jgi:hypothetical protein